MEGFVSRLGSSIVVEAVVSSLCENGRDFSDLVNYLDW